MSAASAGGREQVAGVVLAAGASSRFGAPKQLAELAGRPLLEHALAAMEAAALGEVVVVLGADAALVAASVPLHGARAVECAGWRDGLAASLRTGLAAIAPERRAAVVTLGDQPAVSAAAIGRVADAWRADPAPVVCGTYGGQRRHPVLLDRSAFGVLAAAGETGARELVRGPEARPVPCDGLGDPLDVDTPADLERAAALLAARVASGP